MQQPRHIQLGNTQSACIIELATRSRLVKIVIGFNSKQLIHLSRYNLIRGGGEEAGSAGELEHRLARRSGRGGRLGGCADGDEEGEKNKREEEREIDMWALQQVVGIEIDI
jgi:hypothetical protein